jgi:hypothetical protein
VFNYFSPLYDLPGSTLRAPEFQIFTPSTAIYRANLAMMLTFAPGTAGVSIDLAPFEPFAAEPTLLVEAVGRALLPGRMTPEMQRIVETAITAVPAVAPRVRVQTALYLVASSSAYQVQR